MRGADRKARPARLSALWIFVMFNYLYCDVVGLMDSGLLRQYMTGRVNGVDLSQGSLLGASVLMELPIAMILVSWLAHHRVNRWANVAAGSIMTLVQSATLFSGTPTAYYLFFSIIEIACAALIVRYAWMWRPTQTAAVPGVSQQDPAVR
ncbi:DUF6326 family protein [Streptomyces sp. NPDC060027]|uniref:DUF6326 family protein n=1 Tax=Streptomyces sp. NPDC060027 TaxID=3347040 RepID=UPI0036B15F14